MSTGRATPTSHAGPGAVAGAFLAIAALTGLELVIAGSSMGRGTKLAALVAFLIAKVALVLTSFMRVGAYRRWAALTIAAIAAAVGFAIVLMLDTAVRAGMR